MAEVNQQYFGSPDAAHEDSDKILLDHVTKDFELSLKAEDRSEGAQIIIGIKGSGKTALRRYIQEKDRNALFWNIDSDNASLDIDPTTLRDRSGILKNTLALELIRALTNHLSSEAVEYGLGTQTVKHLSQAGRKVVNILENVPGAIGVKAGPVSVDLAKLLKSKAAPFVNTAWKELHPRTMKALKGKRAYIMIDDAEDVFPGLESNPLFIEGLARAVHDINRASRANLHVLLFLKYGVFRKWFENQQEYDKVEHIIQELSWDHESLCQLIARRIARIHGDKSSKLDVETLWAHEFEFADSQEFEAITKKFTSLCVSGPRDMIVLANRAKLAAGKVKIRASHLLGQLESYSENKIFEIQADFGSVYEDIARFVETVFQGCPEEITGEDAADWIEEHGMTEEKVDDHFRKFQWYSGRSKERLVALMYEVGLFGMKTNGDTVVYSIERPTASTGEILSSTLVVHPAFRPYLGIGKHLRKPRSSKRLKTI